MQTTRHLDMEELDTIGKTCVENCGLSLIGQVFCV